jgi:hypothetical protein
MVNAQLLDERIEQSGLKVGFIVDKTGIPANAFYKKKDGRIPFRTAEIYVLSDLLKLSDDDKADIFFAD